MRQRSTQLLFIIFTSGLSCTPKPEEVDAAKESGLREASISFTTADGTSIKKAEVLSYVEGLIKEERDARIAADKKLQEQIDSLSNDLDEFKKAMREEIARLDKKDAELATAIKKAREYIDSLSKDLKAAIGNVEETGSVNLVAALKRLETKSEEERQKILEQLGQNYYEITTRLNDIESFQAVAQASASAQKLLAELEMQAVILGKILAAIPGDFNLFDIKAERLALSETDIADPKAFLLEAERNVCDLKGIASDQSCPYSFLTLLKLELETLEGVLSQNSGLDSLISGFRDSVGVRYQAYLDAQKERDLNLRLVKLFEAVVRYQAYFLAYHRRIIAVAGGNTLPPSFAQMISQDSSYRDKIRSAIAATQRTIAGNQSMVRNRFSMIEKMNVSLSQVEENIFGTAFAQQMATIRSDINQTAEQINFQLGGKDGIGVPGLVSEVTDLRIQNVHLKYAFDNEVVRNQVRDFMMAVVDLEIEFFNALSPLRSAQLLIETGQCTSGATCEDNYARYFRSEFPDALESTCDVQSNATFANALGWDALTFLARAYTDVLLTGNQIYSFNNIAPTGSQSVRDQMAARYGTWVDLGPESTLFKALVDSLVTKIPSGNDPECYGTVQDWIKDVFDGVQTTETPTPNFGNLQLLATGKTIFETLLGSEAFQARQNVVISLYNATKNTLDSYQKMQFKAILEQARQEALRDDPVEIAIQEALRTLPLSTSETFDGAMASLINNDDTGATVIGDLQEHAIAITDSVITADQLEARTAELNSMVEEASATIQQALREQSSFNDWKLQVDDSMAALSEHLGELEGTLSETLEARVIVLEGKVDNIVLVLMEITRRLGYSDLSSWIETELGGASLSFPDSFPTVQPSIRKVQHFFDPEVYERSRDATGGGWDATNKSQVMNEADLRLCSGAEVSYDLNTQAVAGNVDATYSQNPCWLNFRSGALSGMQAQRAEMIVFRIFGSANLLRVKVKKPDETQMYDLLRNLNQLSLTEFVSSSATPETYPGQNMVAEYLGENGFTRAAESTLTATFPAEKYTGASDLYVEYNGENREVRLKNGTNYIGIFDTALASLFSGGNAAMWSGSGWGVNAKGGVTLEFTPVRAALRQDSTDPANRFAFTPGTPKNYLISLYSPLVLDFKSVGPMRTRSEFRGVEFDLDTDGIQESTGWVDGSQGAFLALDLNDNGVIDNGHELFGQHTERFLGGLTENGFEALAQYDYNQDHIIDERDPVFNKLLLWFDKNVDGKSQNEEIKTLAQREVQGISLAYDDVTDYFKFDSGNMLKYKASFFGPSTCPDTACRVYDVYFGVTKPLASNGN